MPSPESCRIVPNIFTAGFDMNVFIVRSRNQGPINYPKDNQNN